MDTVRALIVVDDPDVCRPLQQALVSWRIEADSASSPLLDFDTQQETFYNLIFIDLSLPQKSGLGLVGEIGSKSPDTKILAINGCADKQGAVRALKAGVFDLIERPISLEFLELSVRRALQTQETEEEKRSAQEALRRCQRDLLKQAKQLEGAKHELQDANTALSVLAHNIEKEQKQSERQIVSRLRLLLRPLRERLRQNGNLYRVAPELSLLSDYVEELDAGLPESFKISSTLSMSEYRIASLIKEGLVNREIADYLSISSDTVKTHRRNIRRKLHLCGSGSNLQGYLKGL